MKATGIVRRIDDLGRVVIPKEIRRTLRIREGDPLEIFTDREGEIILKKYSPIGELGTLAKLYCESLSQTMGCTVCITDMDQIVAVSGAKEYAEEVICPILCNGDVIGSVVFLGKDEKRKFGDVECKVAQSAAEFLGKQMGQ